MIDYPTFLRSKSIVAQSAGIDGPYNLSSALFPFQSACVKWALQKGRCALFQGTGLGKTPQQIEWARHVEAHMERPVLILAPLAVAKQTIEIGQRLLNCEVKFANHGAEVSDRGIWITNYQKLERFNPAVFSGVVWDESSILKSVDGKTRRRIIESFGQTPFRLACTATPAPNDYMELGNHAEALGVMKASEMLATFFVHDGGETAKWRLKRHAERDFWKWMSSWSICIQKPSDIGFDDAGYVLPELRMHEIIVDCDAKPLPGELFALPARTLGERRAARKVTISDRVKAMQAIIGSIHADSVSPDALQWLVWCNLNAEAEQIAKACGMENITGTDSDERKESLMLKFARGEVRRITTKPTIAGFGMNWQGCHKVGFLGLSDSWEQMYQSIRRCWRYGQQHPVDVYIVISSLESAVLRNIKRKEADAQRMQVALIEHMADLTKQEITATTCTQTEYDPKCELALPSWL